MSAIARILSVVVLLSGLAELSPPLAAAAPPSIHDPRYWLGANVAWYNWACDFGCGSENPMSAPPCQWGCGTGQGVSAPPVSASIADRFGQLQSANVHTVRWWMFEGNPWQINRDGSGAPTTLNPTVYADLDAALALADRYDIAYDLVLFEGPNKLPRPWLEDATQRARLADALAPLFERYRDNPHILSWEIFNEPDAYNDDIPLEPIRETINVLATTVHAHTGNLVTVGTAHADNIWQSAGLGLDFYQAHWYPHLSSGPACVPCTDAATVAALNHVEGAPIVVGEFNDADQLQRLKDFRRGSYAGAWAFTLFWDRSGPGGERFQTDIDALRNLNGQGTDTSAPATDSVPPPQLPSGPN